MNKMDAFVPSFLTIVLDPKFKHIKAQMQNQNMNRSPKNEQISNPEVPTTVPVIQTLQETEQAQLLDLEETNPAICEK